MILWKKSKALQRDSCDSCDSFQGEVSALSIAINL